MIITLISGKTGLKLILTSFILLVSLSMVSAAESDNQWPQQAYDNQKTGQSPYLSSQNDAIKWNYSSANNSVFEGKSVLFASTPLVGSDGTVYISYDDVGDTQYDIYRLVALNSNGTLKWTYTFSEPEKSIITHTPILGPDGTIYVPLKSNGDMSYYQGTIMALKDCGTEAKCTWEYILPLELRDPPTGSSPIQSPVIGSDGTIYLGARMNIDDGRLVIFALNSNGTQKWNYTVMDGDSSSLVGSISLSKEGYIYFNALVRQYLDYYSVFYALKDIQSSAICKWTYTIRDERSIFPVGYPTIGPDGTIYVGFEKLISPGSWNSYLYAFEDKDSYVMLKWIISEFDRIMAPPAISSNGTVYLGASDLVSKERNLYSFIDLGSAASLVWKYPINNLESSPIIGADGTIYVLSALSPMHAINPNGTLKWTSNIPSSTKPAIAKDGTLYGGGTFVDGSPELEIYTSIIYAFMAPASDIYLLTSINNPNPTLGDIVTATLKLGNNGPNVAYQTILKFTIPEGMQFINTWADNGSIYYDPATRTVIWNLGDVPVGDPYAYVQFMVERIGNFIITPEISTASFNPNLNQKIQALFLTVHAPDKIKTVDASKTVGMKNTGMPSSAIIMALLIVLGSFLWAKNSSRMDL
ncbi:DUF11 domain-containing protein [Methanobacterium formicicum]|nr:DUF11 domain-containing protein [Methanobacterium formicicum]MDH2658540.1 DUF11 domain-containing protein [Methanobacterium formicicum]